MRYSAPLDGIRAIAILAVLIFHISPDLLQGGFTGVDVFFVLSGFLITSILLHDLKNKRFSMKEFYLRRIQRLLPNLVVMMLAVVLAWRFLLPASLARSTASHSLWALFELSNAYIWRTMGGYWGAAAESAPLLHTWSLAVEEQFYMVFPAGLALLYRFVPKRIGSSLFVATGMSLALCILLTPWKPIPSFYLLPTRVWEMLLGGILAAVRVGNNLKGTAKHREAAAWLGLIAISVGFVAIDEHNGFPGWIALVPTVGTCLILFGIIEDDTTLAKWLAKPFMVETGKLSYSLYLWHWPMIMFGRLQAEFAGVPPVYGALAGGLTSIVVAAAAYRLIEDPLRKRGKGRGRRLAVIGGIFATALVASTTIAISHPVIDPDDRFDPVEFRGLLYSAAGRPADDPAGESPRYADVVFPKVPTRPTDLWRTGGIQRLYGKDTPQVVVLGSSHAIAYSSVIDELCEEAGISVAFLAADSTTAFFDSSINGKLCTPREAFDKARLKWIQTWQPAVTLVVDKWDVRASTASEFRRKLNAFVATIRPHTGHILLTTQVPVVGVRKSINLREYALWRMNDDGFMPVVHTDSREAFRRKQIAVLEEVARSDSHVETLRIDRPFYDADGVRLFSGRAFYYADDDHLSQAGATLIKGILSTALVRVVGAKPTQSGSYVNTSGH